MVKAIAPAEEPAFLPAFGNKPVPLVGRDDIVSAFRGGLAQPTGHPDRATLLVGQPGIGKTALLLEFAAVAEAAGFVVARATATDNLLDDIIGAIQRRGTQYLGQKRKVAGVSAGALGFSVGLTFSPDADRSFSFLNKLALLCEELGRHHHGIVILVDEVQAATGAMRTLATAYQQMVGDGHDIAIAMAGLPQSISSVLNDDVLTFLNRAKRVDLGPLPLGAVAVHYSQVFARLGRTLPPDCLDQAVAATGGYPYLLQLIGFYLVEYSADQAVITPDMVVQAIRSARQDLVTGLFSPLLKPLSRQDLAFLKAMAQDDGPSRVADVERRLQTTRGNAQAYRRRLLDAGVVASPRHGELEFTVPFLAEYLRNA